VKGLYKLVDEGKIKHFTGVDDPYEEPEYPELVIETHKETVEESVARIFTRLEELGYLEPEDILVEDAQGVTNHSTALAYRELVLWDAEAQ